ncbi:MAG: secondary thiamine-phosphate synthase enzyme YjbQ [bacterium]|nr:secondary thiamine-phosphate synthase enzyme YjbQ [bacterium]MDD5756505.1 secondary thiamine-phosphate synthase enzyme YjbQ [bacterium]
MNKIKVVTTLNTEMIDITAQVQELVAGYKTSGSVCSVFIPHTTAGITINENADPAVRRDMLVELNKIVPEREYFTHIEGNSAAHIKASLIGSSVTVPIENGKLALGTWQGIYLCEFDGPRAREVWVQVINSI